MKRIFAMVLALCCMATMLAGCKDKESGGRRQNQGNSQKGQNAANIQPGTVAQPLDANAMAAPPVNGLQDLRYWVADENEDGSLRNEPSELDGQQVFVYTSNMDAVEEYIQMLQMNGWTLVDKEEGYKGGYYSWGLTCDAVPNADTFGQMFTDTACHLSIHWTDSERYKFTFYISADIQVCDMGLRQKGGNVSTAPEGQSACAGLELLADGSYRTTDGRLTAFPGTAMVIRDGQTYTVDAQYENDGTFERVRTDHYYRNEGLSLTFLEDSLMEGDFYRLSDLDKYKAYWEADGSKAGTLTMDYLQVYIANDGEWTCPGRNEDDYEALTVRLMYRDQGGMMVFYVCARFEDDEPETVEALVAVDMSLTQGEVQDATYMQVGDSITLRFNPPEDSESYVLYTWQVLEGDENVWLDPGENTCKVRALDAGSAVIRVTYEYTEAGYNVLTGNPENQPRSVTQDYYLIIE